MNPNLEPISEAERNIDWEEVEYKIAIICNKFKNIEARYRDDLAQELRIHAYYVSDDYYNLVRRAIDYWRTLQVRVMPEVPYFDLEVLGGPIRSITKDEDNVFFHEMVRKISAKLMIPEDVKMRTYDKEIMQLASSIFDIILDDIIERDPKAKISDKEEYSPYHNSRISCSYLYSVLGDEEGSIHYRKIRKAVKFLESVVVDLAVTGELDIDPAYWERGK